MKSRRIPDTATADLFGSLEPAGSANPASSADALFPGFMVVHGNRPESLRALLCVWMQSARLRPLEDEVVLVQSNGVAQWLKLHLASDPGQGGLGGLGISAAVQTQLPSQFVWTAYRALLGAAEVPACSPFDKSRLLWRLMRLLPALLEVEAFAPLRRFLDAEGSAEAHARKLYQLCQRIADLFDQYQVYRADWLDAWARGQDMVQVRGAPQALSADALWQPALWRALRRDVGERAADRSRAEVHQRFLRASREHRGERPAGLPRRITVIGVSSMPQQALETLAALASWCQVLLYVHNPCRHDWSRIVPDHELLRARRHRQAARPATGDLPAPSHPLLAAWGRQGRDFIRLLDEHDERESYAQRFGQVIAQVDCFETNVEAGQGDSLLRRLQDDILELRPVQETRALAPEVPAHDNSIAFHVTHGPQRELEVLHDQLLTAFAADPTLTPRDVMVMVPDVASYAPHIQAVFGQIDRGDARHIPFGIADRSQRQHDPMIAALEQLLSLPQGRLAVSEVLDLLDLPALRARIGIAAADAPLLRRWLARAEVRWGLHAQQREGLGLPAGLEQNSWCFGLRRMFLGYAVGRGEPWQGMAPMDEVGGLDASLLGPLSHLLDLLDHHWRALSGPGTPAQWCERLGALLDDFFLARDGSPEALVLLRLRSALHDWEAECEEAGLRDPLPLAVVREHWLERIERNSLSQPFFSGGVTFASLMPMRAIPFRRIALLGMNDGDYPRSRTPMDFDLMARDYRPGDRSRREDDRYLFLEALLSARDHLHLSWVGRSIRDNEERPASVLVAQLRDHIAGCWRLDGDERAQGEAGAALLDRLTVQHRLQPFHPAYFDGSHPAMASHAREWRVSRQASPASLLPASFPPWGKAGMGASAPEAPADAQALPSFIRDEPFTLREFGAFAKAPVRFFFNQRLRVHFGDADPVGDDQEPFGLDALQRWKLQDELIGAQKAAVDGGAEPEAALAAGIEAMAARGSFPFGGLAAPVRADLAEPMERLFAQYRSALADWPTPLADELLDPAPAGWPGEPRLQDWLGDLRTNATGARCRLVIDSSGLIKNGKYRHDKLIGHWVVHLAGHLAGEPLTSIVISKAGSVTLSPLAIEEARGHWQDLVALMAEGLRRPLPFGMRAACEWVGKLKAGQDAARSAACRCYEDHEPDFRRVAECRDDPYLGRAFPTFEALWSNGEFAQVVQRLLLPLVNAGKSG